ncbi:helix-turn-helix domain-containing protein [Parapedobacter sp. 10938]|uniref:helix-turn-helix domain-containing protein n=1 Tax=Parapedobacter flavus TaxID=3110225 RepID=UPI002DB617EF|nr:helix-turn-helix domain-containing protein [Parapedobacter sp. 10938]MEC3879128.1 helix-turn-helix domain-containing protein [Parapedobacter sp. 10938]
MDNRFPYDKFEQALDVFIRYIENKLDALEKWLSKQQVMEYLDITSSTYYRWVADGTLVPRGGAGEDKFFVSDIQKLVAERRYRKRRKPLRRDDDAPSQADNEL